MKIRKLQLKNIGVFDDEEIEFKGCPAKDKAEIHILTGENGTGKTTLLESITYLFNREQKELQNSDISSSDYLDYGFQRKKRLRNYKKSPKRQMYEFDYDENVPNEYLNFDFFVRCEFDDKSAGFFAISRIDKKIGDQTIQLHGGKIEDYPDGTYAVFAYSGYRSITSSRVVALRDEENFNPLEQSLNFVKDSSKRNQLTINQLIANYISKSAIEKSRDIKKSKKFAKVIQSIQTVVSDITGWKVEFDLETDPTNLIAKIDGNEFDFDVLPDGVRSLISWIGDLLCRVDLLKWQDDLPITEKNLILLLDEIEVHLHPAWQRKVLPVVQKLFKNAQIFVSTHSPFVVNSVDDAWVYKLKVDENGKAHCEDPILSEDGISYQTVLSEIFGIDQEFGGKTQDDLDKFYKIIRNGKVINEKELTDLAKSLAEQSEELNSIVQIELRQLNRKRGTSFAI
ncbi:MAG TPA: AAA family ATPase [Pyrinomonadaceae bacterium]|nr:AAA family ATPase [Pyrinomonadaceae bacterium]